MRSRIQIRIRSEVKSQIRIRIYVKRWIWIRIKVKRIRNRGYQDRTQVFVSLLLLHNDYFGYGSGGAKIVPKYCLARI
jgi:hypothetical protein